MDVNNFQTNTQNTEQSDVNIQQQSGQQTASQQPVAQQPAPQQPAPQYAYQQPGMQQPTPQYTYQQTGVQQATPQYTFQQQGAQQPAPQYTYGQQPYGNPSQYGAAPVYQQVPSQSSQQSSGNGLAVGGMVCGIVSIVFACCCGVGSILGIVGLVLSLVSRKDSAKLSGMALAGVICSAVGLLFSLVYVIYCIINGMVGLEIMEMFDDSYYYYY